MFAPGTELPPLGADATVGAAMTYEPMPEEWQEWIGLTPLERFRRSEEISAQYLAL